MLSQTQIQLEPVGVLCPSISLCKHVLAYVVVYHLPAYAAIVAACVQRRSILARLSGQVLHKGTRWQTPQGRKANQCLLNARMVLDSEQGKYGSTLQILSEN